MKVMTYNVLDGGRSAAEDRTDLLLEVMTDANPDILGICEGNGFDSVRFCSALAAREVRCANAGVLLFVRESIAVRDCELLSPEVLLSTIDFNGVPFTIVVAHLHPYSGDERLAQATRIVRAVATRPNAIVIGDMNAIAPGEAPSFDAAAWPSARERLYLRDGAPDTRAIECFTGSGFVDAGSGAFAATYPTSLHRCHGVADFRLDYILAAAPVAAAIREPHIIHGAAVERASDHRPVAATFNTGRIP